MKESRDALHDVAVRHDHANDRLPGHRWRCREECALAFEDADEPMEVNVLYEGPSVEISACVSIGPVSAKFRGGATGR